MTFVKHNLGRTLVLPLFIAFCTVAFACANASACGLERWDAKVLADGTTHLAGPYDATVSQLIVMERPFGVDGNGSRVASERVAYRMRVLIERDKLEQDGDIHVIIADPQNAAATMVAEIPDPRCMSGAPAAYAREVAQTRLAFVRAFGIPPVTHYASVYREATITGPLFFDFEHGQWGAPTNDAEIHPLLILDNSLSVPIRTTGAKRYRRSDAAASQDSTGTTRCNGDTLVWVNLRSGIYHLPGTRYYGNTRQGEFMCRHQADAAGYRAALNE